MAPDVKKRAAEPQVRAPEHSAPGPGAAVNLERAGVEFVAESLTAEAIREEDTYSGVRVHV